MSSPAWYDRLVASGAIQEGHFELRSGRHSTGYVVAATALEDPALAAAIAADLAKQIGEAPIDVVVSPAVGGIVLGYELARQLGVPRAIYAERMGERLEIRSRRRGFHLRPGDRVLLADDVVSLGESFAELKRLVEAAGCRVVLAACVVDRSTAPPLGIPLVSVFQTHFAVHPANDCPLCARHVPIVCPKEDGERRSMNAEVSVGRAREGTRRHCRGQTMPPSSVLRDLLVPSVLADESHLRSTFSLVRLDEPRATFASHLARQVSRFAGFHPEAVARYSRGEIALQEILQAFIGFIYESGCGREIAEEILASLDRNMSIAADFALKSVLAQEQFPPRTSLLGFGLSDGAYELALRTFLIQQGWADEVEVFGFDPFNAPMAPIVRVAEADLERVRSSGFDLILARWSLHHVPKAQRWATFSRALACLNPGGVAIAVEHGFLDPTLPPDETRSLELLNGFLDVVTNWALRPDWFEASRPHFGRDFFVEYLTPDDVDQMVAESGRDLTADILTAGPRFPVQTLLRFRAH